uniref:Major facilitator superfamily (MFS) profile domain-containing protein n=1 Tax=Ditylenchus dipsaci TaxID=166011 RepID=A0A915ECK2_9BILA
MLTIVTPAGKMVGENGKSDWINFAKLAEGTHKAGAEKAALSFHSEYNLEHNVGAVVRWVHYNDIFKTILPPNHPQLFPTSTTAQIAEEAGHAPLFFEDFIVDESDGFLLKNLGFSSEYSVEIRPRQSLLAEQQTYYHNQVISEAGSSKNSQLTGKFLSMSCAQVYGPGSLECEPEPVHNIEVQNHPENGTVTVWWSPPAEMHHILLYQLYYLPSSESVDCALEPTSLFLTANSTSATLQMPTLSECEFEIRLPASDGVAAVDLSRRTTCLIIGLFVVMGLALFVVIKFAAFWPARLKKAAMASAHAASMSSTASNASINSSACSSKRPSMLEESPLKLNSSVTIDQDQKTLIFTLNTSLLYSNSSAAIHPNNTIPITLVGGVLLTYLIRKFGFRRTFTFYGAMSADIAGLHPIFFFVSMAAICNAWSPLQSSGLFLSFLSCSYQLSMMFTMPIAGELCESKYGWPSVFYLQGSLSAIVLFIFYYFYRDQARQQSYVSQQEIAAIELGKIKTSQNKKTKQEVPYKAMLRDQAVWGVLLATSGSMFGYYIFTLYGPIYLNKVLKMDVEKTGFANAMPYALSIAVKMFAGPLSDRASCVSDKTRIIILACASQLMMAACFLALKLIPVDYPTIVQASFTAATVFNGLIHVGVFKGCQLMSQHLASVIQSWNAIISSIFVLVIPIFVSVLAPDNTFQQWGHIFLIIAGYVFGATMFFNFTAEVKPRPWTEQKELPTETRAQAISAK